MALPAFWQPALCLTLKFCIVIFFVGGGQIKCLLACFRFEFHGACEKWAEFWASAKSSFPRFCVRRLRPCEYAWGLGRMRRMRGLNREGKAARDGVTNLSAKSKRFGAARRRATLQQSALTDLRSLCLHSSVIDFSRTSLRSAGHHKCSLVDCYLVFRGVSIVDTNKFK